VPNESRLNGISFIGEARVLKGHTSKGQVKHVDIHQDLDCPEKKQVSGTMPIDDDESIILEPSSQTPAETL